MNHEQAFLQAIRENPDDDAPRLIYADWLEEQGGAARSARAAFIRIQCRLDELPDDDPARDRLEDEATELLAEHEAEWTQRLHGISEGWRFTRGFIEHIRINHSNWDQHAERLFAFTPLRSLQLLTYRNSIPSLASCPHLQGISILDLSHCQLNDRSLQQLLPSPYLSQLTALNLEGNDISTPGVRTLLATGFFARLRRLNLGSNRGIGDSAIRLLAQTDPANHLEFLNLGGTNLTMNGLYDLFGSTRLPNLRHLSISPLHLGWASPASPLDHIRDVTLLSQLQSLDLSEIVLGFAWLRLLLLRLLGILTSESKVVNLRSLALRQTGAESKDAAFLAECPILSNLTSIDLSRNKLGADGVRALIDSPNVSSLTHLNLGHNNIRDAGAKAIAASPRLTQLRELNITGNGIGGPGLKALAESANLERIRSLSLGSNFIGADSVRAFAECTHLRRLTFLDLSDASLEEDSARALASSQNLARLTTLLLHENLLGDGGAKALAWSPHLTRLATLDLNDNRLGKAGAEALAVASWRRMRNLDLRGNVFTDTQEALLRQRFGNVVQL